MINKDEIITVANETGLTPQVVEKDYLLGWLLAAINANQELSRSWFFKGGTCLKKCYFETYRFSEDLDFTLADANHLDNGFLKAQFSDIAEWLYENAGIEAPADRLTFDIYNNPRGGLSCEGRVYYQSFFASGKKNIPKIKLDLTADEILVLPPSRQSVFHAYSDLPAEGFFVNCYAYPEVFGEKIRALAERGRPRDLYDVINLFRNDQLPASAVIRDVLDKKCAYKGIARPNLEVMAAYKEPMLQNWSPMLAHQLPSLPALEAYWDTLPNFFAWLESENVIARPSLATVSIEGELYRPVYGRLGLRTSTGSSLEIIRFAAGNRLCVELDYTDQRGNRSTRVIEPYSLRRAQNGNVLLFAVRADSGEIRAYSLNSINSASITNRVFTPRYQIELNPSGALAIAQDASALSGTPIQLQPPRALATRRPAQSRKASVFGASNGPTYIFRCSMCGKTFKRNNMTATLNAHKNKNGGDCMGRVAIYVRTEY